MENLKQSKKQSLKISDFSKAEEFKNQGNDLYRDKKFECALLKYQEAINLNPNESTYYLNQSACLFEMQKYEECIKKCDYVFEKETKTENLNKDKLTKALNRKGNALMKLGNLEESLVALLQASHISKDQVTQTLIANCVQMIANSKKNNQEEEEKKSDQSLNFNSNSQQKQKKNKKRGNNHIDDQKDEMIFKQQIGFNEIPNLLKYIQQNDMQDKKISLSNKVLEMQILPQAQKKQKVAQNQVANNSENLKKYWSHNLYDLFWNWTIDSSSDPQDEEEMLAIDCFQTILIEKQYGQYMGSRKDPKYRYFKIFLENNIQNTIDLQEMLYIYDEKLKFQNKKVQRQKVNKRSRDPNSKRFGFLLNVCEIKKPMIFEDQAILQSANFSLFHVIDGLIKADLDQFEVQKQVEKIPQKICKSSREFQINYLNLDTSQNKIRVCSKEVQKEKQKVWQILLKKAQLDEIEEDLSLRDYNDINQKACQLMSFIFSMETQIPQFINQLIISQYQQKIDVFSYLIVLQKGLLTNYSTQKRLYDTKFSIYASAHVIEDVESKMKELNFFNIEGIHTYVFEIEKAKKQAQCHSKEGKKSVIIQIDVPDSNTFKHFKLAEPQFTAFPQDKEIIVDTLNVYRLKSVSNLELENDLKCSLFVIEHVSQK